MLIDMSADRLLFSASFGAAGQRCMAVSVVVAVGDIADELLDKINEIDDNTWVLLMMIKHN